MQYAVNSAFEAVSSYFSSISSHVNSESDTRKVTPVSISLFQERVEGHFQQHWISLRTKSVGRAHAEAEYAHSAEALEKLRERFIEAQKLLEKFKEYSEQLAVGQDKLVTLTFEKIFNHSAYMRDFYQPSPLLECSYKEIPFDAPTGYSKAVGVVIQLKDGRYVMTEPTGHHEGFRYSLPNGKARPDESLRLAALRVAKEQSGLHVALGQVIGDFPCKMRMVRLFRAIVVGGDPAECNWKTAKVHFVPQQKLYNLLFINQQKAFMNLPRRLQEAPEKIVADNFYSKKNEFIFFLLELKDGWNWLNDYKPRKKQGEAFKHHQLNRSGFFATFPFDETLVRLSTMKYISASHVILEGLQKRFIAAEGPIPSTIDNFWQMVFDQTPEDDTGLVVMLTDLFDNQGEKCAKYWPNLGNEENFSGIRVKNLEEECPYPLIKRRKLQLQIGEIKKTVIHLQRERWPDGGAIPECDLYELVRIAASISRNDTPAIVHCSMGVGRTGCFILAYALLFGICRNPTDLIASMRDQRPCILPDPMQALLAIQAAYLDTNRVKPRFGS